ncbi:MAG: GIY-YIG nuclease family protein [Daejeonella sp.]
MEKGGYVYIMTNKNKTTLYIGVTSDLRSRVFKHRQHFYPNSFTAKYNLTYCIYYEYFLSIQEAIKREKELKKWRREKKVLLINKLNPAWDDLWEAINRW